MNGEDSNESGYIPEEYKDELIQKIIENLKEAKAEGIVPDNVRW